MCASDKPGSLAIVLTGNAALGAFAGPASLAGGRPGFRPDVSNWFWRAGGHSGSSCLDGFGACLRFRRLQGDLVAKPLQSVHQSSRDVRLALQIVVVSSQLTVGLAIAQHMVNGH